MGSFVIFLSQVSKQKSLFIAENCNAKADPVDIIDMGQKL